MADQVPPQYRSSVQERGERSGVAIGFVLFAGMLMIMIGIFQALAGIVGIVNDNLYVITRLRAATMTGSGKAPTREREAP